MHKVKSINLMRGRSADAAAPAIAHRMKVQVDARPVPTTPHRHYRLLTRVLFAYTGIWDIWKVFGIFEDILFFSLA